MPTLINAPLPDLNRNATKKIYTNADLPKVNHPPDILDDIEDNQQDKTASPPDILDDESLRMDTPGDNYKGPDTFLEGFLNSFAPYTGESTKVGAKGALGYLKGAIVDIPQSLWETGKSIINTGKNLYNDPSGTLESIPHGLSEIAKNIGQSAMQSGGKPEEFGEMMGQITGQPIVTAKVAPHLPNVVGGAVEGAGRYMKRTQPISGLPGHYMLGRTINRTLRNIERVTGGGIEKLGQKMRLKTFDGKNVGPVDSPFVNQPLEGEVLSSVDLPPNQKALPPSKVSFYHGAGEQPTSANMDSIAGLKEGQELPIRPKIRVNNDGTFTNMTTGEVFDKSGKPVKIESAQPQIDRDSPFFKKNRKY